MKSMPESPSIPTYLLNLESTDPNHLATQESEIVTKGLVEFRSQTLTWIRAVNAQPDREDKIFYPIFVDLLDRFFVPNTYFQSLRALYNLPYGQKPPIAESLNDLMPWHKTPKNFEFKPQLFELFVRPTAGVDLQVCRSDWNQRLWGVYYEAMIELCRGFRIPVGQLENRTEFAKFGIRT